MNGGDGKGGAQEGDGANLGENAQGTALLAPWTKSINALNLESPEFYDGVLVLHLVGSSSIESDDSS